MARKISALAASISLAFGAAALPAAAQEDTSTTENTSTHTIYYPVYFYPAYTVLPLHQLEHISAAQYQMDYGSMVPEDHRQDYVLCSFYQDYAMQVSEQQAHEFRLNYLFMSYAGNTLLPYYQNMNYCVNMADDEMINLIKAETYSANQAAFHEIDHAMTPAPAAAPRIKYDF